METKENTSVVKWAFDHPFIIVFSAIVIAAGGYQFGQWLYQLIN
jgi:predicted ABC-type exoprotein transport system permease subunit